jgi:iron complex outermembrane receptor protein
MRLRTMLLAAAGAGGLLACASQAGAQDLGHSVSEVVITASPLAGDPDRFATIVEQVSRDQVLSNGGASLADALRNVPGVAGTGFAAGASRPVIRGMDAQRVKLAENGLSSSDVSDVGPDHGVPIDPLAAQQIEVVRGAATLRYGSQAIGGVVNVINNRIPLKPIDGIEGETTAAYSTSSATGEGTVSLDAGQGPFAVHLDGFGRRASNYDTPDGVQPNSFFRGNGYSGGASYFFGDDSRVGASGTHYEARYGIPSDDTFIRMKQDKGAVGGSFKFGQGLLQRINVDAGYADYTHSEIDPETNEVLSTFNNKEWDGRGGAVRGHRAALGLGARRPVPGPQVQRAGRGGRLSAAHPHPERSRLRLRGGAGRSPAVPGRGARRARPKIDGTPATGIETSRDLRRSACRPASPTMLPTPCAWA